MSWPAHALRPEPTCAHCPDPAIVQVRNGSARRGKSMVARYLWLCDPCADEHEAELGRLRRG